MKFNSNGYMEAGIHEYSVKKVFDYFVSNFEDSTTRECIFNDFINTLRKLKESNILFKEVWIDGSYVTNKLNPNDIDAVIFIENSSNPHYKSSIINITNCDIYFAESVTKDSNNDDINIKNYWRGQWGFDRDDIPKGFIKITFDEFNDYLAREG